MIFCHELALTVCGRQGDVGDVMGGVEERIAFQVGEFGIIDGIQKRCPLMGLEILLQGLRGGDPRNVREGLLEALEGGTVAIAPE